MKNDKSRMNSISNQILRFWVFALVAMFISACDSGGFDETPADNGAAPTLSSVTVTSSNANGEQAAVGDTITVSIAASESILAPSVTFNGNSATSLSGSGAAWTATYLVSDIDTSGPIEVVVNYSDVAGNSGTSVTNGSAISVDVDAPVLEISGQPANAEMDVPFTVSFTFSEGVSGFELADIVATNATLGNFTGASGNSLYTVEVTPSATEQVDISVAAGSSNDASGNASTEAAISVPPKPTLKLIWSDEFDGAALDLTKWNIQTGDGCAEGICGWGNNEQQLYTASNITVNGGMLNIEARQEVDNSYTSARINTKGKMDVKFGRIEVNARLPEGQGTWPAIWMLSTDEVYGGWPLSGEIDIVEAVNLGVGGKQTLTSTLHYGLQSPQNTFTYSPYEPGYNPQDGFHTYAVEWEANEIRFFVDDVHHSSQISDNWYTYEVGSSTPAPNSAPFDQAFHLLLNLAIGGNLPGAPDAAALPQQYAVDWVRVYECTDSDPATGEGCTTANPTVVPVAAQSGPSVKQLEIYTNTTPATITAEVQGVSSSNTLVPDGFNNGNAMVVSEFDFVDAGIAAEVDNTVWHVGISGDLANVFLSSQDLSSDDVLETGFNLMGGQDLGELIFDMKVNTLSAGTDILIKMDSGFPNVGQVKLATPAIGEWKTYSVRIADLIANPAFVDCCNGTGLNLADVLNLFVLEPANANFAAIDLDVYLDNIRVEVACKVEGACKAEPKTKPLEVVTVYDDAVGSLWDYGIGGFDDATGFSSCNDGASCGDIVSWTEVAAADAARGTVIEFNHVVGANFAGEFIQSTVPRDMSAFDGGTLNFDIQVLDNGGNNGKFIMKVDCVFPCTSGDQQIDVVGENGWETITIPISQLISGGLDTSNVNTGLVIFPAPGQQSGVVYQLDNVYWDIGGSAGTPLSSNAPSDGITIDGADPVPAGSDLSIYVDGFAAGFASSFFANDGTVVISEVDAEDTMHGKVLQIEAQASQQVTWISADPVLDVTGFAGGTLEFDILVTQSPTDPTAFWQAKSECVDCGSAIPELTLGGQTVITKDVWHHVSIAYEALGYADPTQVNLPLVVFPNWGGSTGAIYQIDNVRFVAPAGGTGPTLSSDPSSAGVTINPTTPATGDLEELVYIDGLEAGYIFGQYDEDATGATTIMTVDSMDATHGNVIEINNATSTRVVSWVEANPVKDLSAYADGVLAFDIFVVTAPNDPTAIWKVKGECGGSGCGAIELTIGGQTLLPPGEWHHVEVSVPSLLVTDLTTLKNVVVFNNWEHAAGSVYRLDNIVWKASSGTPPASAPKVLYEDAPAMGYSFASFGDGGPFPTITEVAAADTSHGMVFQIDNSTTPRAVAWIGNDSAEDISSFASGTLTFDLFVVTAPSDSTATYRAKLENGPCPGACVSSVEIVLGDQTEIMPGQWYSFEIPVADFFLPDLSQFRRAVFFNDWEKAAGSVYQIDNVQFNQ